MPVPLQPEVGSLEQAQLEVLQQPRHELVAVAEVRVEGGPLEAGAEHDLLDRHLAERALAQQRFRRREDLALGVSGIVPAAPAAWSGGRARSHAQTLSNLITRSH